MKKSELRTLIRECIQEVLSEAYLMDKFRHFVESGTIPPALKTDFVNFFAPVFRKTAENPAEQAEYVIKAINVVTGAANPDPATVASLKDAGLDLNDRATRQKLSRLHPFLAKFKRFIEVNA